MNQQGLQQNKLLKVLSICLALMLSVSYILFSFQQAYQLMINQTNTLILKEKEEITTAFHKYNQYLNLIESRLSHSLLKKETISRILMEKVEPIMGATFPMIINLEFAPTSNPSIVYTRVGTALANATLKMQEGTTYLGEGLFRVTKQLYDENKKTLGTLIATFSVSHLLYKHFSKNEVHVVSDKRKTIKDNLFSFKVLGLPYLFVVDRNPPSFLQFILSAKLQVISIFTFGIMLLMVGIGIGASLSRKIFVRQYNLIRMLKDMVKTSVYGFI